MNRAPRRQEPGAEAARTGRPGAPAATSQPTFCHLVTRSLPPGGPVVATSLPGSRRLVARFLPPGRPVSAASGGGGLGRDPADSVVLTGVPLRAGGSLVAPGDI